MKKLFLALAAAVGVAAAASASSPEIQIGYGGYTQMDATDMHNGGAINNAWGALNVGINFRIAPKVWVGPSYTFSSSSFKGNGPNIYYHVFMLNLRYEYWRNSIVTLYAHAGLGADISHIAQNGFKENKGYFAFQATPLGAQVDLTKSIAMFGELGFGAQGLVQVGVRIGL